MVDDIELIKHMTKLDVRDGDVVVVAVKHRIPNDEYQRLAVLLKRAIEILGVKAEFIILDGEQIDIGVMRADTKDGKNA